MNERPITEAAALVGEQLRAQDKTRSDLARDLKISRQQVTRTLNSTALLNPRSGHWPAILDALGLEVIIRPKKDAP